MGWREEPHGPELGAFVGSQGVSQRGSQDVHSSTCLCQLLPAGITATLRRGSAREERRGATVKRSKETFGQKKKGKNQAGLVFQSYDFSSSTILEFPFSVCPFYLPVFLLSFLALVPAFFSTCTLWRSCAYFCPSPVTSP